MPYDHASSVHAGFKPPSLKNTRHNKDRAGGQKSYSHTGFIENSAWNEWLVS
jgi:hypothetical protein